MELLQERLKKLRKNKRLTQTDVASYLGLTTSAVYKYEVGKAEPNTETLQNYSKLFNVSLNYLLTGTSDEKINAGFKIPVLGTIPAGIAIEAIEEMLDYEEIPQEWTSQGEYFGLKVKGNSMEPRIMNGDVVIVRKQNDAESGDVCVIMVNGNDATLKAIKKDASGISLVPYNSNYSPMFYSNEQIASLPVRIIGKVVELRGKF